MAIRNVRTFDRRTFKNDCKVDQKSKKLSERTFLENFNIFGNIRSNLRLH